MSDTIRTFIAVEIPEKIVSSIANLQDRIKEHKFKIRWVRPERMHLTLKFLGDIVANDIEKVGGILVETVKGCPPLSLKAKGMGVFPGIKRPRVIWVGISGQLENLLRLQKSLDENLEDIGFPREKRPFKGHLTLGRIKTRIDSKKLGDALRRFGIFESETFTADKIVLYRSELKPSGAVYTKLVEVSLTNVIGGE